MSNRASFIRIYSGPDGETHFEDYEAVLTVAAIAPPAPPAAISEVETANGWQVAVLPPAWYGDWHPTPRLQMWLQLAGELEVEVSDGEVRRLPPGTIARLEDVGGRGHRTRVIGDGPVTGAYVRL